MGCSRRSVDCPLAGWLVVLLVEAITSQVIYLMHISSISLHSTRVVVVVVDGSTNCRLAL